MGDKSRKLGNKGEKQMAIKDSIMGYERADKASRLTLEYYFKDPEWFDSMNYFEDRFCLIISLGHVLRVKAFCIWVQIAIIV